MNETGTKKHKSEHPMGNVRLEENDDVVYVPPDAHGRSMVGRFRIVIGTRHYEKVGMDKEGRHVYRRSL